jgi:DnaK suppressor protein
VGGHVLSGSTGGCPTLAEVVAKGQLIRIRTQRVTRDPKNEVVTQMSSERERLEQALEETLAKIEQLNKKLADKADYGIGKGGPTIYEWEFNLALRQSLEEKAKSIKGALRKMQDGNYGLCEVCGQEIDAERLAVLPHTTLCIKCAQARRPK